MNELENLNVGDEVIIVDPIFEIRNTIEKVVRITKTLIILSCGLRFRKDNGKEYGDSGHFTYSIHVATPEEIEEIKAKQITRKQFEEIFGFDWSWLSDEDRNKVYEIISKYKYKYNYSCRQVKIIGTD